MYYKVKQDTVWLVPRKESKFKEVPYQKLRRFIAAFGSYRSKTLKTVNFGKKWPNFRLKWPKFRQIRIFQEIFEEIILYMPWKFQFCKVLAILNENLAIFGQNWQFWEFLAYNFHTPLRIFLIFGMEVVLMALFEKIILYIPGKFWYGEILAI